MGSRPTERDEGGRIRRSIAVAWGNSTLRSLLLAVPGAVADVVFSIVYAVLGLLTRSPWTGTLAAYYLALSIVRLDILLEGRRAPGLEVPERERRGRHLRRRVGVLFLAMTPVLGGMAVLLRYSAGGKSYPGLAIYAAALYAFARMGLSVVNLVRCRGQHTLLLSTLRQVSLVDACVSMLTLQTAMLDAFGSDMAHGVVATSNTATASVVAVFVLVMGVWNLTHPDVRPEDGDGDDEGPGAGA